MWPDSPIMFMGGGVTQLAIVNAQNTSGSSRKILKFSGTYHDLFATKISAKQVCEIDASGFCKASTDTTTYSFTDLNNQVDVSRLWFFNAYWISANTYIAFIHEECQNIPQTASCDEPSGNMNSRIGLAYTTNSGENWKYLGRIIYPYNNSGNPVKNIGGGSLVAKDGYFYYYIFDKNSSGTVGLSIARASVNSVISAAQASRVTNADGSEIWKKWSGGSIWDIGAAIETNRAPAIILGVGSNHAQAGYDSASGKIHLFQAARKGDDSTAPLMTWIKRYTATAITGPFTQDDKLILIEPADGLETNGGYIYCSTLNNSGDINTTINGGLGGEYSLFCEKNKAFGNAEKPFGFHRFILTSTSFQNSRKHSANFDSSQGPEFQYKTCITDTFCTDMVYANPSGPWQSPDTSTKIWSEAVTAGTSIAQIQWQGPNAGIVQIIATPRARLPTCGDGATLRIWNGTTLLASTSLEYDDIIGTSHIHNVSHIMGTPIKFDIISTPNNVCDTFLLDPYIRYF